QYANKRAFSSRGGVLSALAKIAGQSEKGEIERRGEGVMLGLDGTQAGFHFGARPDDKRFQCGGIRRRTPQTFCRYLGPPVQALVKFVDVRGRIIRVAEVREKQTRRPASKNGRQRSVPDAQINIGRGRGRQDERAIVDADSGSIADKREAF